MLMKKMMSSTHPHSVRADPEKIEQIKKHLQSRGDKFPKFGILVLAYNHEKILSQTLDRIPRELWPAIHQVYIFDDHGSDKTFEVAQNYIENHPHSKQLRIFRNPFNRGYGGNQKNGYHYTLSQNIDYVIMLHGDGQYAPEYLPDLMLPVFEKEAKVVFASRMLQRKRALEGGMPLYKWIGNTLLTWFENKVLGTKLSEFHTGYRLYAAEILSCLPFDENTDDFHFDTQIIIQCRALGVAIHEVPIPTFYGDEVCHVNGLQYAFNVCRSVLEYRLHQLHLLRRPRYLVTHSGQYTRKHSRYSSHGQILSMIDRSGLALDMGSGQGLLTRDLLEKNVQSVCVDIEKPENVKAPFLKYIQHNLENCQDLEKSLEQQNFDYIIFADVIEHVRNAAKMLFLSQNFIHPSGKIIISVPNIAIWFYRLSLLIGRFNYGPKGTLDETHIRFYTLSTILKLIKGSGLVVEKVLPTSLPFEIVFESSGQSGFIKFIDKFYYKLATWWPEMFAYQFVIQAKVAAKFHGEEKISPNK